MSDYPNIAVNMIDTGRLNVCVREVAERGEGRPVVFVHGNVSSSPFFFPLMATLPEHVRPIAVDLRGFGGSDTAPVDATRGLADFADDVWSTVDALGLPAVDLVGWSMGGGVVLQMLLDRPRQVTSVTLINPVSPYGFGGTVGADGAPVSPGHPGLGSGGGTANPAFVAALVDGDTTDGTPASPRSVFRAFYVAPDWSPDAEDEEDIYVTSMLSTVVGEDNYPGTFATTSQWPGLVAGTRGVLNTMSPHQFDVSGIVDIDPKPPIAWIRGDLDQIVSDASMFDLAQLGAMGAVPGYPGQALWPPQPMVTQTRTVLERYAAAGGSFTETVIEGAAHSPHIENVGEVSHALRTLLGV